MPKFFVEPFKVGIDKIIIDNDDVGHISKVLRHREGDVITVCDGEKNDYICRIDEISRGRIVCAVLEKHKNEAEPDVELTLYLALPKGDKADFIVQKAVELGAGRIVMFEGENSVAKRPKDARETKKKLLKWQKTALEAAKQCGRGVIPKIDGIYTFGEAVEMAKKCDVTVFLHEKEETGGLYDLYGKSIKTAALFVGPEGGFSPSEAEYAKASGAHLTGLGRRILRLETAAVAASAIIMHITHNL